MIDFLENKWNLHMEPDRFQHSPKVYIIGMICMLISMVLFGLGAYILPKIAFNLVYNIPDFIYTWSNLIQIAYGLNEKKAGWLILTVIFLLGVIASIVTYAVSNRIENQIYFIEPDKIDEHQVSGETGKEWRETGPLVLKILLILVLVFVISKLFQWAISIQ